MLTEEEINKHVDRHTDKLYRSKCFSRQFVLHRRLLISSNQTVFSLLPETGLSSSRAAPARVSAREISSSSLVNGQVKMNIDESNAEQLGRDSSLTSTSVFVFPRTWVDFQRAEECNVIDCLLSRISNKNIYTCMCRRKTEIDTRKAGCLSRRKRNKSKNVNLLGLADGRKEKVTLV